MLKKRNEFANRRRLIDEKIRFSPGRALIAFSAKTGEGKEFLWREIKKAVELDIGDNL